MNEVKIIVKDLELKNFLLHEASALFKMMQKNKAQVGEWLVWVDNTNTVEEVIGLINEFNGRRKKGVGLNLGIWHKDNLIGYISVAFIDKARKTAGIAYWLDDEYQGKGIMTKSCKALIEYVFNEMNINKIEISCAEGNVKSRAIPERLGFKKERIIKESELVRGGKLVDNHLYVLNKHDWEKYSGTSDSISGF